MWWHAAALEEFQVDGEDPLWEVEAIVNKKGKASKMQYLIKWKGMQ